MIIPLIAVLVVIGVVIYYVLRRAKRGVDHANRPDADPTDTGA